MPQIGKRLRAALLTTALASAAGGIAYAQIGTTFDPAQLPATQGRVAQYSLTPRGDVDGLILEDGIEVHLPPHLGAQLVFAVKPGDRVTVHGLRSRGVPVIDAMQVTNDASRQSVTDTGRAGPPGPRPGPGEPSTAMEASGRIKAQLHGPRGDLNGVLLEDGTIVHLPPLEAQRLAGQLAPGGTVAVRGDGLQSGLGRVIAAQSIGPDLQRLVQLQTPPRRPLPPGRDTPPPPPAGPAAQPGPTPDVPPPPRG